MTTNEREIAIREGHKIHSETSYFTPRPQLDFENARHVFGEGFDRGYIAATAEANKRVNALEGEVAELKAWKDEAIQVESEWDCQAVAEALNIPLGQSIRTNILPKIIELQASNNDLREALGMYAQFSDSRISETAKIALSATPAESLQAHDDELIEKCAKVATDACLVPPDGGTPMSYEVELCDAIAESIRALKEVK